MKKNIVQKIVRFIILSVVSLAGGYAALVIPFSIFDTLSREGMQVLFAAEIVIYFLTGMLFLCIADQKKRKAKVQKIKQEKRRQKIKEYNSQFDIAA